MFSSGVSARALRFALASLAGSPAPLALRGWGPRPFPLRPPAPCGRALRYASGSGRCAPVGESGSLRRGLPPKSRLGASPFGRSVAALPFWRQPPPPSVFLSRSAPPCVSPRLPARLRLAFVAIAPQPRGCPSLRGRYARPCGHLRRCALHLSPCVGNLCLRHFRCSS